MYLQQGNLWICVLGAAHTLRMRDAWAWIRKQLINIQLSQDIVGSSKTEPKVQSVLITAKAVPINWNEYFMKAEARRRDKFFLQSTSLPADWED